MCKSLKASEDTLLGMLRRGSRGAGQGGTEVSQKSTAIIQERDGSGLEQGRSSDYDEKWPGYGYFKGRTERIC